MQKPNIALVAGGDSGEYKISIESARMIKKNIDPEEFNVFTIVINRKEWVYVDDHQSVYPVDKNDFSVTTGGEKITFSCAFITIHGTPGEDGKLQGYFDLLGIPYTTSGLLPTALTFNKYFCNQMVAHWGLDVARSVKISRQQIFAKDEILDKLTLPVFIKPNKGGSSLGTTFVKNAEDLQSSLKLGFEHDDEIMAEEYIEGDELTCGVFIKDGKIITLPVTQIISKTAARFFDYEAKYTTGAADEITPAPIPPELTAKVQQATEFLYRKFELKGLARIDFIYSRGRLFFLEVNITPGMAATSIVPQQAAVEGIPVKDLFTILIRESMKQQ